MKHSFSEILPGLEAGVELVAEGDSLALVHDTWYLELMINLKEMMTRIRLECTEE